MSYYVGKLIKEELDSISDCISYYKFDVFSDEVFIRYVEKDGGWIWMKSKFGNVVKIKESVLLDLLSFGDGAEKFMPTPAGYEYNKIPKKLSQLRDEFIYGVNYSVGCYSANGHSCGYDEFYLFSLSQYLFCLSESVIVAAKRVWHNWKLGKVDSCYFSVPARSVVKRGRKLGWRKPERVVSDEERTEAESLWEYNKDIAVKKGNIFMFIEAYRDYCLAVGIAFKKSEAVAEYNKLR